MTIVTALVILKTCSFRYRWGCHNDDAVPLHTELVQAFVWKDRVGSDKKLLLRRREYQSTSLEHGADCHINPIGDPGVAKNVRVIDEGIYASKLGAANGLL